MGGNYFLGFEYGFCKNHSIGIDFSFTGAEGDSDPDSAGNILSSYSNDKTVYLNYRYYLDLPRLRESGVTIYTGMLARYGKRWDFSDPGRFADNTLSEINEYKCAGLFLGSLIRFKKQKRLGLDANFRFFYKQSYRTEVILSNKQLIHFNGNFTSYDIGLGLNLYWCFYRYKKQAFFKS